MSKTVLSIDVGIKNLSFCLLRVSQEIEIMKWNTINLNEPSAAVSMLTETKQPCTTKLGCKLKPCYAYHTIAGTQYACKRHYKSTPDVASRHVFDEKPVYISRMMKTFTMEKLRDFCKSTSSNDTYSLDVDKIKTKTELREKAAEILKTSYVYPIEVYDACMNMDLVEKNTVKPPVPSIPSKSSASTVSLVFVGYNLMKAFDALFYTTTTTTDAAHHIDTVVIENQISPIANRMKTVQGMITQYFLMRGVDKSNIIYYSSVQKLKVAPYHFVFHTDNESENGDDNVDDIQTYDERKKAGVACVRKILSDSDSKCNKKKISDIPSTPKTPDTPGSPKLFTIISDSWLQFFEKHGKKDDMADSFLQGLSYIIKNYNHQIQKI
jgi:hypothetical protein